MTIKIKRATCADGSPARLLFRCPGCNDVHAPNETWTFNGDYERPTLSPSVLVTQNLWAGEGNPPERRVCHSFVRDGRLEFLSDCTHALAGQTVDLPEWRDPACEPEPNGDDA